MRPSDRFGGHREWAGCIAKLSAPREYVGEGVACGLHREGLPAARSHRHIQAHRVRRDAIHGTGLTPKLAANHAHVRAVVVRDFRNLGGLHLLVTRRSHFERGWEVGPKLEAM